MYQMKPNTFDTITIHTDSHMKTKKPTTTIT